MNNLNPNKFAELRLILAKFATNNSITDLKAAYKFMLAVDPDSALFLNGVIFPSRAQTGLVFKYCYQFNLSYQTY